MLRRLVIGGVWVGLLGLLGLLAWGVFRVSAADTINAAAGGPARTNWEGEPSPSRLGPLRTSASRCFPRSKAPSLPPIRRQLATDAPFGWPISRVGRPS